MIVNADNSYDVAVPPPPPGFRHATAQVDGATIHYLIGGHGPPVMLLHGWPVTAYAWRGVAPALTDRFTVIAADMPGFGDSGPSSKGYQKRVIMEELRDLVHQLGFTQVLLVGHDMGGPAARARSSATSIGAAYCARAPLVKRTWPNTSAPTPRPGTCRRVSSTTGR